MLARSQFSPLTGEVVNDIAEAYYIKARNEFWYYRYLMNPHLKRSWWQDHYAVRLQVFYNNVRRGRRPKLVADAPPQHGKSNTLRDFFAWCAGKDPDFNLMFASYSDDLGIETNLHIQRAMASPCYQGIFPHTKISGAGGLYRTTSDVLQFVGKRGSFRNTTVNGAINGFGLDIGGIDDPLKGRAESRSMLKRNHTWEWMTNDFMTRFADHAGVVMIMTRWHVDDPVGRWLAVYPNTEVLIYSAVAEKFPDTDDKNRMLEDWTVTDGLRQYGDALFPEHKSIAFLMERKASLTQDSWAALYQQRPIVTGGGIFPIEKIRVLPVMPVRGDIAAAVRYIDKAATVGENAVAETAMVLLYKMRNGTFVIADVQAGHMTVLDRERLIKHIAEADRSMLKDVSYEVVVEQEPGSGGKESAESTIRNLAGFRVFADRVSGKGSKDVRADPFAAQVQAGNVFLIAGAWNKGYLDQLEAFPNGTLKDRVDASSGAFNRATGGAGYDTSMDWGQ